MFKKFTSAAIAASLLLSACAVLPVQAEESSDAVTALPEWVPGTYDEAKAFYLTHGKTYVQDGLICTARLKYDDDEAFKADTDLPDPLFQQTLTPGTSGKPRLDYEQVIPIEITVY
ncbi:MAG: hypothetical protein IKN55_07995, partial [Oscillospiraceae bacterium]|nr:hypothetical protein [Oscillospiraceae bacterium]